MYEKRSIKVLEFPFTTNHYKKINQKGFNTNKSYNSKIVACDSNIYEVKESGTFKRYHSSSKNKNSLPSLLDKRSEFCVCSFMQKIYVFGGESKIQ